jgi:hypothetical protein
MRKILSFFFCEKGAPGCHANKTNIVGYEIPSVTTEINDSRGFAISQINKNNRCKTTI